MVDPHFVSCCAHSNHPHAVPSPEVVLNDFLSLMYHSAGLRAGRPIPPAMRSRHVHFTLPVSLVFHDAHFDDSLVKTLERWTLQYVILQPLLAAVHIASVHLPEHMW